MFRRRGRDRSTYIHTHTDTYTDTRRQPGSASTVERTHSTVVWRPSALTAVWRPSGVLRSDWKRDSIFSTNPCDGSFRPAAAPEHDESFFSHGSMAWQSVCRGPRYPSPGACAGSSGSRAAASYVSARPRTASPVGRRLHGEVVLRCSRCHASNPPIHITAKVGNTILSLDLCEKCAVQETVVVPIGTLRCPKCGVSAADIQARGRIGCAEDYSIFASSLEKGLEQYHGASQHVGKIPSQKLYSA